MLTVGIDEAGRGPLAGPVTAGAVILGASIHPDLNDSKRLSIPQRERLAGWIHEHALAWAVGWASHSEIDEMNILRASHLAMKRALDALWIVPERAIVDGSVVPWLGLRTVAIVRADSSIPAVMAASVLAKVARDRWMIDYHAIEPQYGYAKHKGYPTREHRLLVATAGPSLIQRLSFRLSSGHPGTRTRDRAPS